MNENTFLRIRNLDKFIDNNHILKDINIEIKKGHIHALIGPNGAGKSTLIKTILNLYTEFSGEIKIDGLYNDEYLSRNNISYIPVNYFFPKNLSLKNFLIWNAVICGRNKKSILHKVNFYCEKFNLKEIMDKNPNNFSSGQKQLVLLAKVLIEDNDFLIMDEPTANLDPNFRLIFFQEINNISKNKTILICTHQLHEIDGKANSITLLKKEGVIYNGAVPYNMRIIDIFRELAIDLKEFQNLK